MIAHSLGSFHPFTEAYVQSDFFGKSIMLGLFALSIVCWVVLIHKIRQSKQVKASAKHIEKLIKKHKEGILSLDPSHLRAPLPKYVPQPFAEIYCTLKEKTVEMLNKKIFFLKKLQEGETVYLTPSDIELLEQHALIAISAQSKLLERHLFVLSTIVTLAPFLGLLGTVWGILVTFAELHNGGAAGSSSVILGGLSTALATTVLGLVIAIPALLSYNYLKNNLKSFSSDMEDFLYTLLSLLELEYRKADLT